MEPQQNSKKIQYGIGAIVVLAVIAIVLAVVAYKSSKKTTVPPTVLPNVKKTDIDPKILPANFPTNIPLEKGAVVTQNYTAESIDGHYQSTRAFESKKTVAANDKIYSDFFTKDDWKVVHTFDQDLYKVIVATKGNQYVQVSIQENATTHVVRVEILYSTTTPGLK